MDGIAGIPHASQGGGGSCRQLPGSCKTPAAHPVLYSPTPGWEAVGCWRRDASTAAPARMGSAPVPEALHHQVSVYGRVLRYCCKI